MIEILGGDCREVLAGLEAGSFHACVTDPPYLLEFMGKAWDRPGAEPFGVTPFEAWFAGFVAGEGCFRIQSHKDGKYYTCTFAIHLRADEAPILTSLRDRIGGRLVFGDERTNKQGVRSNPDVRWLVETREACWTVARILDRAPLFARKANDYRIWRRALQVWTDTPKGSRWHGARDVSEMSRLHDSLKQCRRFGEPVDLDFDPFMPPMQAFHYQWAREVYRVLKPGAHLLAFGGSRTFHRLACAIEDAGFEIRDTIMWIYGSGFPKSLDVGKALDRAAGAEPEIISLGRTRSSGMRGGRFIGGDDEPETRKITAPATEAAREWQGWGTALKPSMEIVLCAQKKHDVTSLSGILARKIWSAICQLPSRARDAERSSSSSRNVFGAAGFSSAQWDAVAGCNTPADLSALMGMWPSGLAIPSSLSIGWSWLNCLAAISTRASTFTTETASSLTTDLKTLNSLLSQSTADTIIQAAIHPNGTPPNASLVARLFNAVSTRLEIIRELSAHASASGWDATSCGLEGGQIAPNADLCVVARKPLSEGTVAANVLRHGTGALNIDASRVATGENLNGGAYANNPTPRDNWLNKTRPGDENSWRRGGAGEFKQPTGRWPANCAHDGSPEVLDAFARFGSSESVASAGRNGRDHGEVFSFGRTKDQIRGHSDSGTAARFFYEAKADASERVGGHPTIKPVALMEWLVRLVTPPGGRVLDPFCGTGSTLVACDRLGFDALGIEQDAQTVADAHEKLRRMRARRMIGAVERPTVAEAQLRLL